MPECPSCNYNNPLNLQVCMVCGRKMSSTRGNPSISKSSTIYPVQYAIQTQLTRPKIAVFDLDDTLFDAERRLRASRRAGLVAGGPYVSGTNSQTYPQGKAKFLEFFDSPKRFRTDTPIEGALDYVLSLISKGYAIAYITGRRSLQFDASVEHLKSAGFPIFESETGVPLLFMKANRKNKTSDYKRKTINELKQYYDVHYFFDDQEANRKVAIESGVIGVYDLRHHLASIRGNPFIPGVGAVPWDSYEEMQKAAEESGGTIEQNPSIPKGYRQAAGCLVQRASDDKVLFLRRSRKETSKRGLYEFPGGKLEKGETPREAALIETKEEAGLDVKIIRQLPSHVDHTMKKVYHCFLAVPKKNAKVALSEEHDMHKWVSPNKKWQRKKLSHHARFMLNHLKEAKSNPNPDSLKTPTAKRLFAEDLRAKEQGLGLKTPTAKRLFAEDPISFNALMAWEQMRSVFLHGNADTLSYQIAHERAVSNFGEENTKKISDEFTELWNQPKPSLEREIKRRLENQEEQRRLWRGVGQQQRQRGPKRNPGWYPTPRLLEMFACPNCGGDTRREGCTHQTPVEERQATKWNPALKPKKKRTKAGKMRKEPSKKYFQRMMSKLSKEFPDNSQRAAVALSYVEKHYGASGRKSVTKGWAHQSPRANPPPTEKQLTKAKKAYKKFHGGKEPEDVTTETIDVGSVWYALGPCWSIGYMSPKETGDDEQKYIHHTNEDSKDGNYPMLYATVPESGEQMFVIRGGSTKLGPRNGLAWLID